MNEEEKMWTELGTTKPLEAVLTNGRTWNEEEFYKTGDSTPGYVVLTQALPKTARVLDYGCGVGRVTMYLAKFFKSVVAVDISTTMLAKARAKVPNTNVEFKHAPSVADIQFDEESFNGIICDLVIQHNPHPAGYTLLAKLLRWLKPGGTFLLQIPDMADDENREFSDHTAMGYWMHFYNRKKIEADIDAAGCTFVLYGTELTDGWKSIRYIISKATKE